MCFRLEMEFVLLLEYIFAVHLNFPCPLFYCYCLFEVVTSLDDFSYLNA